ncbi:MAG: acyl-CoA thioesterase [Thermoleophilia bacterium]|nr:acyl-CoA thioesterase [Thermoleophilia bacterium]
MTEVVFPQQLNHHGTLFGGEALSMMDRAAFVAATRHCRSEAVTIAVDQVDYVAPVRHGEIVEVLARVVATGRTSMTVRVSMVSEELLSGERRLCGTGRFVFVAIDDAGNPIPVPPLEA